jgi:predicted RNase H-like HicB family nuclease
MTSQFTAVYQQRGEWWIAFVEEVPGANTQGRSLEEARANLREAVELVVEANRQDAISQLEGDVLREPVIIGSRE